MRSSMSCKGTGADARTYWNRGTIVDTLYAPIRKTSAKEGIESQVYAEAGSNMIPYMLFAAAKSVMMVNNPSQAMQVVKTTLGEHDIL